ncbi:hypothetical protein IEQ34_018856 [Dendrobium chrysotoxum]|uniref:Uncharacterized protein n=1 Tax=Dendrobium chrysotoxum TaxID=161865 RepID=A0AAV7G5P8_DENCH|nr:hypothetical protein IEQ34_018856 [Dendrobium chrysotoxum]
MRSNTMTTFDVGKGGGGWCRPGSPYCLFGSLVVPVQFPAFLVVACSVPSFPVVDLFGSLLSRGLPVRVPGWCSVPVCI